MPRPLFHRADGLLKGILFLGKLKGIGRSLEIRVCFLSLLVKNGYLISVSELGLEGVEGVRQSVLGDFACLLFAAFLAADIQGQDRAIPLRTQSVANLVAATHSAPFRCSESQFREE